MGVDRSAFSYCPALYVARDVMGRLHILTDPVPVVARVAIQPYTAITVDTLDMPDMVEVAYLSRAAITQPAYADPGELAGGSAGQ